MVRTYYQQRLENAPAPIAIGRRAHAPLTEDERRRIAEEEQKRILDEQIAEKKRERMQQQAREQAEILDHYRNYQLAGGSRMDRDLETFIEEKRREPVMFQPPPPAEPAQRHGAVKYGAMAAQVTDKMESERDRRLRLRAEERSAAARRQSVVQNGRSQSTPRTSTTAGQRAGLSKRDQIYEEKRRQFAERKQMNGGHQDRGADAAASNVRVARIPDDMDAMYRPAAAHDDGPGVWEQDLKEVRELRRAVVYASDDPLPSAPSHHPAPSREHAGAARHEPSIIPVAAEQGGLQQQRAKQADYARELREQMEHQQARKQRHTPVPEPAAQAGLGIGERGKVNSREAKEAYARELKEQMEERKMRQERERELRKGSPSYAAPPPQQPPPYGNYRRNSLDAPPDPQPRRGASPADIQYRQQQQQNLQQFQADRAAEAARKKAEYARELQMQIEEKKARQQREREELERREAAQRQQRQQHQYHQQQHEHQQQHQQQAYHNEPRDPVYMEAAQFAEDFRMMPPSQQYMPSNGYGQHDDGGHRPPPSRPEQPPQTQQNQIARDLQQQVQEKMEREDRKSVV